MATRKRKATPTKQRAPAPPSSRKRAATSETNARTAKAATRKVSRGRKPSVSIPDSMAKKARLTVRHYCQGIGDCHLLRFKKDDGSIFHMLIDCGVHSAVTGGNQKIRKIVEDIKQVTNTIDVLVATHEHWDHLSGFLTAKDVFATMDIHEIWMGWTENGKDKQARTLDKYKRNALAALQGASRQLDNGMGLNPYLQGVQTGLEAVTGFYFGAAGERVRSARDAALEVAGNRVKYLEPTSAPLTVPDISDLRIYVLGPPREEAMLRVTERSSEMYGYSMSRGLSISASLVNAVANYDGVINQVEDDVLDPFDKNIGTLLSDVLAVKDASKLPEKDEGDKQFKKLCLFIDTHYAGKATSALEAEYCPDQVWRRIDMDWLGISADLAMQLDNRINNTSVVLAFEFVESGRVFLFSADAQVGSWLSWQDLSWKIGRNVVTGSDLLKRTVYYKVGHHGSQNATLKTKGLELMNSPDLVAFVPTNEADAKKVRWGQMPYKGIMDDLLSRTAKRVVRADDVWIANGNVPKELAEPSGALLGMKQDKIYVEFQLA